jgi:hypothetical protein
MLVLGTDISGPSLGRSAVILTASRYAVNYALPIRPSQGDIIIK